ncbi:hypothetical protein BC826DRAFT_966974 [Russula brevipes]|nr:hypothetical protein BC826DRAFT_966974 [Russula brevipes]
MPPPPPQPSPQPAVSQPSVTPVLGNKVGLCGLTANQWHMVLIFGVPPLLIVALVAIVVSWITSKDIFMLWLGVQQRVETARMGAYLSGNIYCAPTSRPVANDLKELRERLLRGLLSEADIRNTLIAPDTSVTSHR